MDTEGEFYPWCVILEVDLPARFIDEVVLMYRWNIPIHVDAASGGFVAPFLYPDLVWDFRLPLVKSINVSGHKYGLVYAGIGWVVWRGKEDLPEELIFHVNYLGADQPTFTLNFSKGLPFPSFDNLYDTPPSLRKSYFSE